MSEDLTRMGRQRKSVQKASAFKPIGTGYFIGIGINDYQHWPPLKNAVRDINAIAQVLKTDYGYSDNNMRLLFNQEATEGNIIELFEDLASQIKPTDSILIYYAGHGHLNDRGRGFWVPVDAPEGSVFRYIRNSTIKDYIGDIKSLHTLLISDSCFSGSLFSGTERSSQLAADELSRLPSRWAICSGRHDEAVADGPEDGNSPFAESIMDVLKHNKRPVITAGFLVNQVIDQTRSNYDQLPDGGPLQNVGHKRGQFIFRRQGKEGINKQWKEIQAAVDNTLSEIKAKKKLIRQFITDYPDNDYIKAALELGRQMEQKRALLEAWDSEFGLIAFIRQDSPYREEAQARLNALQNKETKKSYSVPKQEPIKEAAKPSPVSKTQPEAVKKDNAASQVTSQLAFTESEASRNEIPPSFKEENIVHQSSSSGKLYYWILGISAAMGIVMAFTLIGIIVAPFLAYKFGSGQSSLRPVRMLAIRSGLVCFLSGVLRSLLLDLTHYVQNFGVITATWLVTSLILAGLVLLLGYLGYRKSAQKA